MYIYVYMNAWSMAGDVCRCMYVSSGLVLTPVVPPRPGHPCGIPVSGQWKPLFEKLYVIFGLITGGPLAIEPRDETLCAIYWPTHAYNPLPFISPCLERGFGKPSFMHD